MKTVFAVLVMFSAFVGVYSFFGLPVEITQVKVNLESAWSLPQQDAHLLAMVGNILDNDQLFLKFKATYESVHNTLDALHTRLVEKVSNTSGDPDELFRQLRDDIQNAVSVISDAKSNVTSLSGTLINVDYASLVVDDTLAAILTNTSELLNVVNAYEETVVQIRASPVPVTSENINQFLTNPKVFDVSPVVDLASNLNNLHDEYNHVMLIRVIAVNIEMRANQFIEENYSGFPALSTKSVDELTSKLKQRAESHLLILQNTFNYTSILDPAYYNYGEKTITDYFANLTIVIKNCYELYLSQLTSNLQHNITVLLEDQKQTFTDSISKAVHPIVDSASLIPSYQSSLACVSVPVYYMVQVYSAVDRLNVCYQPEPALIAAIYEEAKTSLDAILDYIIIPQEKFTLCNSSSGACFNKFVKHLPKYVQRMKPHIAGALRRISKKLQLSLSRMQLCGQLVRADMMDFFEQQKPAVQSCLAEAASG